MSKCVSKRQFRGKLLVPVQQISAVPIQGSIQSIGPNSIKVDGQTILISPDTRIEGTLAVGKMVKVVIKGMERNTLLAHKITVVKNGGYGSRAGLPSAVAKSVKHL